MKSLTIAIILICGAFALNAQAQTSAPQKIRANIPFAFNVGEKTLPAGVYTVTVINPTSDRKVLQIRSGDGRFSSMTQTSVSRGKYGDEATLMFRRYGEHYFFAQAQMAGDSTSLATAKSRAERTTRRAIKQPAENTVVAAF